MHHQILVYAFQHVKPILQVSKSPKTQIVATKRASAKLLGLVQKEYQINQNRLLQAFVLKQELCQQIDLAEFIERLVEAE